jgi:hypothetical protein
MDAVSGLLRVSKSSPFSPFRKLAVLLDIEVESLVGEDRPLIADGPVVIIISGIDLARYRS